MELTLNYKEDYRLIYTDEDFFLKAFKEAYIGSSSLFPALDFVDVLVNMTHAIAYYYFILSDEQNSVKRGLNIEEEEGMIEALLTGDYIATNQIMENVEERFIELFARDLHIFLRSNGFFYFEYDYERPEGVKVYNSPIDSVW